MRDLIALQTQNSEKWASTFFSLMEEGAAVCLLNPALPPLATREALERLQPRFFLSEEGQISLSRTPSQFPPQSVLLFTSGSSGAPKIAVLSYPALLESACSLLEPLGLSEESCYLASLPFYHVGGLGILLRTRLAQGKLTWDPEDPAITHLSYVPTQLLRARSFPPRLQCLLVGGAPLSHIPLPHPAIRTTYGLTEMGSAVTLDGRPLPGREVNISAQGEILVRGKTLFSGYWDEKTGISLPLDGEGWFATRDLGAWDSSGNLIVEGRKDRMFISGGENIQPEEIEKYLLRIPAVLDALVVPKEDPLFGMRPEALLVSSDPALCLEKVRELLSEHLPRYKLPVSVRLCDSLPKRKLGFRPGAPESDRQSVPEFEF